MEETKWLTKTKIIILIILIALIGIIAAYIIIHKNNLRKDYINYESQLEYAAPNYLLKEKISLKENEWREIKVSDLLKQKLIVNKRSSDCDGYVIAQGNKDNSISETTKNTDSEDEQEDSEKENTKEESKEKITTNITYKAYIKCKKIYTTEGYGSKKAIGKQNIETTQTQKDTEKPKITLFGDETITLTVGDTYEELKAMAVDNVDKDITNKIKITGNVDTTKAGTYKVKYTVADSSNNTATTTRIVIVKEKEQPKEETKIPQTTTPETKTTPTVPSTTPKPSTTPSVYVDKTAPVIIFNDNSLYQTICKGNSVNISTNGPYGYVARDNVDGNITSRVKVTGDTGIINNIGTFNLYYEVSDNSGNVARATKQFSAKDCSNSVPKTTTIIPVTSITVTPNSRTISVGTSFNITTTILPGNATNKTLTYESSNKSVAIVDSNGTVKGISKGTSTIKIISNNGKVGTCIVTVQ